MRKKVNTTQMINGKLVMSNGKAQSPEAYRHFLDYRKEYDKARYRRYTFRLVSTKEPELIAFLESHAEVNGYLRHLIQEDYKRQVAEGNYNPESNTWAEETPEYKENQILQQEEERRAEIVKKLNEKYGNTEAK